MSHIKMSTSSFKVCYTFELYKVWLFPSTNLTESRVLRYPIIVAVNLYFLHITEDFTNSEMV